MNTKNAIVVVALFGSTSTTALAQQSAAKNVLFIIVDDLRPELGCYNSPIVKTPNIDKLASEGVLFDQAFCNIPVSGASRTSLLTGMRPTHNTIAEWYISTKDVPEATTINRCFFENGYTTISNGKVFHTASDQKEYWSEQTTTGYLSKKYNFGPYSYNEQRSKDLQALCDAGKTKKRGPYLEASDAPDSAYLDYRIADKSIENLQELSKSGKPFFLVCGFIKPHLPFVAPKKYFDMYDLDDIHLPESWKLREGNNIPARTISESGEIFNYSDAIRAAQRSEEQTKEAIRGYYACVSYVDAQVGRVLDELKRLGLDKTTTVVLIGDHGWNLAEHGGMLCKHTVHYHATHATMIIKSPGVMANHRSSEVVEFVDLYPTICDFAGVTPPSTIEGESLRPLCEDVDAKSKGYAVIRWYDDWCYTDGKYFYSELYDEEGNVSERMLFDHANGIADNYNLIDKPHYSKVIDRLQKEYIERRGARWSR